MRSQSNPSVHAHIVHSRKDHIRSLTFSLRGKTRSVPRLIRRRVSKTAPDNKTHSQAQSQTLYLHKKDPWQLKSETRNLKYPTPTSSLNHDWFGRTDKPKRKKEIE